MYYLCLWWQIVWCWNMSFLCQLCTISSYLQPTLISSCTFPFEHITSSHSHLYSILLTLLLYILPLLTYLWFGFLVLLFVCVFLWFGFLVAAVIFLFCRNSTSFPPSIPTYHFWRAKKFEGNTSTDWIPRVPNQPSSKCKKHCKQFVELARCERVMTTRAEYHFSWVYTFFATTRSLRIWATHPPRETGCDPAPPAQLCWSSSSSFTHICTTTSWNWTVTKLI